MVVNGARNDQLVGTGALHDRAEFARDFVLGANGRCRQHTCDTNALGFGAACKPSAVPLGATAFKLHDAVDQATAPFLSKFPYLFTPLPGATN